MAKLPIVSGTEAVKALKPLGFFVDRQRGILLPSTFFLSYIISSLWAEFFNLPAAGRIVAR
jgi:hypothetical protein